MAVATGLATHVLCFRSVWEATAQGKARRAPIGGGGGGALGGLPGRESHRGVDALSFPDRAGAAAVTEVGGYQSKVVQRLAKSFRGASSNELRSLPGKIERLEAEIESLQRSFVAAGYYQQETARIRADQQALNALESELEALYRRWEDLESG